MINNVPEREAIRLRSDIYWSARQWQKSAEQTELLLADRWRGFVFGLTELSEVHHGRPDIRVAVHRVDLGSVLMFGSAFWFECWETEMGGNL